MERLPPYIIFGPIDFYYDPKTDYEKRLAKAFRKKAELEVEKLTPEKHFGFERFKDILTFSGATPPPSLYPDAARIAAQCVWADLARWDNQSRMYQKELLNYLVQPPKLKTCDQKPKFLGPEGIQEFLLVGGIFRPKDDSPLQISWGSFLKWADNFCEVLDSDQLSSTEKREVRTAINTLFETGKNLKISPGFLEKHISPTYDSRQDAQYIQDTIDAFQKTLCDAMGKKYPPVLSQSPPLEIAVSVLYICKQRE